MEIPAVVLAAGEGRRLRPLTRHRPKPMLPVASKPILEHVFDSLLVADASELIVVVGYGRDRIQSFFGSSYRDVPVTYVVQEHQLGTGHALSVARSVVGGPCLVVNGDQIVDGETIDAVASQHRTIDAVVTLGVMNRTDVGEYGGVLLDGDRVTEIVDSPRDDRNYRLNAGVYVVEPTLFDAIDDTTPRAGEHPLTSAFRRLLADGESVRGVVASGTWIDVKYPWDLLRATETEIGRAGREPEEGDSPAVPDRGRTGSAPKTRDPERIDPSATIHETAVVDPSTVVAAGCEVGPGAVVGPDVCLNQNVTVGSNAVVDHSVVDMDSRIGENATVIDCVVGQGVRVGPGSVLPGGPSDVRIGDRVHANVQFGTLLADRVRDEGGSTYVPGSVVGADVVVRSGTTVDGTIPSDVEVRS